MFPFRGKIISAPPEGAFPLVLSKKRAKVLLFSDMCKYFVKKNQKKCILHVLLAIFGHFFAIVTHFFMIFCYISRTALIAGTK